MDVSMPEVGGLEAAYIIRQRFLRAHIILLSALTDKNNADHTMISTGAIASLDKSLVTVKLEQKIQDVY
jgi:CheY-like chemotaxis protein